MPVRLAYFWVRWLARRRRYAFAVLAALVLAAGVFFRLAVHQAQLAGDERQEAYEALLDLERLLSTVRDAETGQRGYLLAGKPAYLEPYVAAMARVEDALGRVNRYPPFSPELIGDLNDQIRAKLAELATTVDLYRRGDPAGALALVRTDRGKIYMDQVRGTINGLLVRERTRVEASQGRLNFWKRVYQAVFVGFLASTATVIVGLVQAYSREERARQAGERELERQAGRHLAITRSAPGAIITADRHGFIDEWNLAAEQIFGWTADEILGRNLVTLLPERYRAAHLLAMSTAAARGQLREPDRTWEFFGLRKDGTEFPAEIFPALFTVEGVLHCIGIVQDITPRRHLEAQQAELRDELQRSNVELQQFAYVASHDLQEPLRMVNKFVGLLVERLRDHLDDQTRAYAQFVRDGAQRMQQLIGDLLRYSRVSTSARPPEPVLLVDVLVDVRADLHTLVERTGGTIQLATDLPVVRGSPSELRQLFQNLVGNGLKYHRPGVPPVVTVACTPAGAGADAGGPAGWHFAVADNGIGIPADKFATLFQLFARLHAREEYEGTGIGLAICKKIVERHGGRIWLESVPGQGSTFHFTLPRRAKGSNDG